MTAPACLSLGVGPYPMLIAMHDAYTFWPLIGWLSVLAGGFAVVWGISALQRSKETWTWPSTMGTVLSSKVATSLTFEDGTPPRYEPAIIYRYQVAGKTYQGKSIKLFGVGSSDKASTRAVTKRYRVGRIVTVFYNPSSPDQAVLKRGNDAAFYLIFVMAVGFLALGAFLVLNGVMLKHRAPGPNESMEPTGDSRFARNAFVSQWRLPPVAHAERSTRIA